MIKAELFHCREQVCCQECHSKGVKSITLWGNNSLLVRDRSFIFLICSRLSLSFCKMIWHCSSSIEYWCLFIICKYLYQSSHLQFFSLMLAWVVWGSEKGFALVVWLLINIARVGVKVRVGLEKKTLWRKVEKLIELRKMRRIWKLEFEF